jgi:hypothetical protein
VEEKPYSACVSARQDWDGWGQGQPILWGRCTKLGIEQGGSQTELGHQIGSEMLVACGLCMKPFALILINLSISRNGPENSGLSWQSVLFFCYLLLPR